ncbi:putative facilitated trehalose transporter tret1-like protein [Operophtera brumata]|uniref:Putative facilitated trehalose transporter tret1-like protein n=1 Tax=Operophtera brumata TaxID=104452 RepID=A0A0L7L664_OPEBR|nr:putative facilitated trehalose transporter tret1-like protein [Operophtera brumata]
MNASSYKLVQQNTATENKKSEHILLKEKASASSIPPEEPRFCTKTSWLQLGYGLWANLTLIGIGLNYGFPAVTMPQLREPESSHCRTKTMLYGILPGRLIAGVGIGMATNTCRVYITEITLPN